MAAERITSRQNPLMQHLHRIGADRKYRRKSGSFLVEGDKLVGEALRWWGAPQVLVYTEDTLPPDGLSEGTRLVEVPGALMDHLSTVETPQHLLALCPTPALTLPERLTAGSYLVLDGVQDPGNVGTIWRTADAFGADGLILLPGCADPFSPKTVRSSMGACFRLPVWTAELEGLTGQLAQAGIPLWATALRDDTADVRQVSLRGTAVVIGSEGRGVSPATLERCTGTVRIPMRARCESLNAAVAASVVLWEMAR